MGREMLSHAHSCDRSGPDRDGNQGLPGSWKKDMVEMGKRVWPDARKVVYMAREAGHSWMMHYSAKITMWKIHNWLDAVLLRRKEVAEEWLRERWMENWRSWWWCRIKHVKGMIRLS